MSFNRTERQHATKEMLVCAAWYAIRDCKRSSKKLTFWWIVNL